MSVVIVLIGLSMLVAGGFLFAFLWAVRTGQYDDRYTPSVRMLLDDRHTAEPGPTMDGGRHSSVEGESSVPLARGGSSVIYGLGASDVPPETTINKDHDGK